MGGFFTSSKPCGWCSKHGHRLANCPEFHPIKLGCSPDNYHRQDLLIRDRNGYCAAGIMAWQRDIDGIFVAMLSECRNEKLMYNFPGGKRDSRHEHPLGTALREWSEEIGGVSQFNNKNFSRAMFYALGKYVLFPVEVDSSFMAGRAHWLRLDKLTAEHVHPFVLEMVEAFSLDNTHCIIYNEANRR